VGNSFSGQALVGKKHHLLEREDKQFVGVCPQAILFVLLLCSVLCVFVF
jgi:hypothetical protein